MNLGALIATLGVDTKGLDTAVVKMRQFSSETKKQMAVVSKQMTVAGKSMKKFGRNMSMFVTLPLVGAGGYAYKMASDMEEAMNKVEVSFGQSSDAVKKWSETTLDKFGLASVTALDMSSNFGDMATSMGFGEQQASDMSTTLVSLAADMASFKNIRIDVANTALAAVFTGETESLKRMGIVMTQVNLQEYAMRQGINKSIKTMTQAEKVQLRYNYILEKTANSQGDFARTVDAAANQGRIFKESLKEIGATFGEVLLPIITPVVQKLNKMMKRIAALTDTQKKWILGIAAAVAAIGPLSMVLGTLFTVLGPIGLAVAALATVLGVLAVKSSLASDGQLTFIDYIKTTVEWVGKAVRKIQEMMDKINNLRLILGLLEKDRVTIEVEAVMAGREKGRGIVEGLKDQFDKQSEFVSALADEYGKYKNQLQELESQENKNIQKITETRSVMLQLVSAFETVKNEFETAQNVVDIDPTDDGKSSLIDLTGQFKTLAPEIQSVYENINYLDDAIDSLSTIPIDQEQIDIMRLFNDEIGKQPEMYDLAGDAAINWAGILQNSFAGMSNVIGDALQSTEGFLKSFWDFFKDWVKGLVIKLIAAAAAALALAVTLEALGMGGGKVFKSLGKAASFMDVFKSGFGAFSGAGMAQGGIVPPGYNNDSFPARLSSGEAVIPLDRLSQLQPAASVIRVEGVARGEDIHYIVKEIERKQGNTSI